MYGSQLVDAIAVGTVEIPVKLWLGGSGLERGAHSTIRLANVLHIPSSICNVFAVKIAAIEHRWHFQLGGMADGTMGKLTDGKGRRLGYLVETNGLLLPSIKLSAPPIGLKTGPSTFENDSVYAVSVQWPDSERARWKAASRATNASDTVDSIRRRRRNG